jgi:regulator of protease activity HflC (stomatin/prohibitin superfamily)
VAAGPPLTAEERVRRSVRRTLVNGLFGVLLVAGVGAWAWQGAFALKPGEAAVLLLLGRHYETITRDGFHWRLRACTRHVVTSGAAPRTSASAAPRRPRRQKLHEATMQTRDNNIVR